MKTWSEVVIGDVLTPVARFESRDDLKNYQFAGTYSYARGIFRNEMKAGSSFSLPSIQRIEAEDFIYCKIMAWEGAFGLAGEEVHNCWMSGAFVAFQPVRDKILPRFLHYWFKAEKNWRRVAATSTGTNVRRKSLHPDDFLRATLSLPPLSEQQRIVSHLDAIESRLSLAQKLREEQEKKLKAVLNAAFHKLVAKADWVEMAKVAPLVRRAVDVDPEGAYPELGIRSFGRGTFHKPAVLGVDTTKRLFEIHTGDLVFSNVFAWEGAIAVARPEDHGRFGSHRFISCVCDSNQVIADYLKFYFLTTDGLEKIGKASPGGAGRNRTLGIEKLADIKVPIVPLATQLEFTKLLDLQNQVRAKADISSQRTTSLLPSLLDSIFSS